LNYHPSITTLFQLFIPSDFIAHSLLFQAILDHLLILIQARDTGFDLQKHDFLEISAAHAIKNQIIHSLTQKHQVFVMIREIRQKWSYFLIHMTQNHITGLQNGRFPIGLDLDEEINPGYEISQKHSDNYSDRDNS
jgi:hypothetical protein